MIMLYSYQNFTIARNRLYAYDCIIRERFSTVSKAVALRKKDLTKITTDQAAFLAQKDSANGKKTMKAYLWMVCGLEYDQAHQG